MSNQVDIAVSAPDERVQLVVEVKNVRGASPEWAAQLRRNLLVHGLVPNAPYFLLALPDRFYLWKAGATLPDAVPADYTVDTRDVLGSYTDRLGLPLTDLSEPSLELLVTSWLHDLIDYDLTGNGDTPLQHWLVDSGLYQAIKHGSVTTATSA